MNIRYDFHGKTVGITGAASPLGIGYAIAEAFLRSGAQVFICDLNAGMLEESRKTLSAIGTVRAYAADVSDETAVREMFTKALQDFGHIDIFISNAGIYPQRLLKDMSFDSWKKTLAVNLDSVFLCAKEAFKCMKEHGGVLINAASFAALKASAGSGAYAASKAAVYSLTQTLAAEFAPYGIRVNGFIPGVIATGMTQPVVDRKRSELENAIALHALGKPQDVANAVLYLCADESAYLTGTFAEISGGKLCVQNPHYPWQMKEQEES